MKRRHFVMLAVLSGIPPRVLARTDGGPRIGYLAGREGPAYAGFLRGMRELGYIEGHNIKIEFRSAGGNRERLAPLAAELVAQHVDLIACHTLGAAAAAREATTRIPIVMSVLHDPVAAGWVASWSKPGGNLTGIAGLGTDLVAKRVEILREALPHATRIAVLINPAHPLSDPIVRETEVAAARLGMRVQAFRASQSADLAAAYAGMAAYAAEALVVAQDQALASQPLMGEVVRATAAAKLPAIYAESDWAPAGGLMTFGPSIFHMGLRISAYVDKILKGAKPGDLPIEQPTRFELVINARTAKAIGLTLADTLLARADEVIE
jgi:putative tryptophan/tyrosine transport system substrate-binding protein